MSIREIQRDTTTDRERASAPALADTPASRVQRTPGSASEQALSGKSSRGRQSGEKQESSGESERSHSESQADVAGSQSTRSRPRGNPSMGPVEAAEQQFGRSFDSKVEAQRIQRLAQRHPRQVQRWIDEGVPTEAVGKPADIQRWRDRKDSPVPWNAEQQNQESVQRNAHAHHGDARAGDTSVPDSVRDVISSPGQSLDPDVQRTMESEMGDSFSDVQVHTGPKAAQAWDDINARAFTVGNNIAFNHGEYDPGIPEGQHVLAHELAHVRQQTGGAVSMLPQENLELEIDPDPELEQEAEETAQRVMQGGELGIQRMSETDVHVQQADVTGAVSSAAGTVASTVSSAHQTVVDKGYEMAPDTLTDNYEERQEELTPAINELDEEDGLPTALERIQEDIQTLYQEVRAQDTLTQMSDAGTGEAIKLTAEKAGEESQLPFGKLAGKLGGAALQAIYQNRDQVKQILGIKSESVADDGAQTGDYPGDK